MSQVRRFFASLEIPDRRAASRIVEFDFFDEHPEKGKGERPARLNALLTLEQVEKLVRAGFPVLVQEDATRRLSAPVPVAELEEWLEGFHETFPDPTAPGKRPAATRKSKRR